MSAKTDRYSSRLVILFTTSCIPYLGSLRKGGTARYGRNGVEFHICYDGHGFFLVGTNDLELTRLFKPHKGSGDARYIPIEDVFYVFDRLTQNEWRKV